MFVVESYAAVRRFVCLEGHSRREAARVFGLSRDTIAKMCRYSTPPGYVRSGPAAKPTPKAVPGASPTLASSMSRKVSARESVTPGTLRKA